MDDIDTKIDTFLKTFSSNSDNMLTQDKVDELLELLIVNQKMTFEKCWMKNQETDCDLVVLNSLIDTNHDITPSYSVNMDPKTAELFRGNQSLGKCDFNLYIYFLSNYLFIFCHTVLRPSLTPQDSLVEKFLSFIKVYH